MNHRRTSRNRSGSSSSDGGSTPGRPPASICPAMRMLPFTFRSIEELELGERWRAVFDERWPHYREWFLREGEEARPSYATSARMLRAHMPELVPPYDRVVELHAGGDLPAALRSLYEPPPSLPACSQ